MTKLLYAPAAWVASAHRLALASGSALHILDSSTSASSSSSSSTDPKSHTAGLIRHIAISPDETHVATLGENKALRIFSIAPPSPTLLSTRTTIKRGSNLSFASNTEIIVSDKVGDVYSYPFHPPPSESSEPRPTATELASDPSRNPDATLLLGHVSVVCTHLITPNRKRIITADRDEHIRVSRYPKSHIIERYLLGSDGFVSALHIPQSQSNLLLSAGGEPVMRIWDWTTGDQVGSVDIWPAVLPHRRVRSSLRRQKQTRKKLKLVLTDALPAEDFYEAPVGYMLPSGQGVCVKKIESLELDGKTIVLFYSEGCAALHSFVWPPDLAVPPDIHTLSLPYPLLDFVLDPSDPGQILVSLDTAWGILKHNQSGTNAERQPQTPDLSEEDISRMSQTLAVVAVSADGLLSDTTSSSSNLLSPLYKCLSQSEVETSISTIASLDLYPELTLFPRWPGFEEDDELAGTGDNKSISEQGTGKKEVTQVELEKMNTKQLGRMKAQGANVADIIGRKRKEMKVKGKGVSAIIGSGQHEGLDERMEKEANGDA